MSAPQRHALITTELRDKVHLAHLWAGDQPKHICEGYSPGHVTMPRWNNGFPAPIIRLDRVIVPRNQNKC